MVTHTCIYSCTGAQRLCLVLFSSLPLYVISDVRYHVHACTHILVCSTSFPHPHIHTHIHTHIHSPTHAHSLGISMLEVSCDLELPSGGQNWHLLRQGRMPEDFTKGSGCPPGLSMGQWFDQLEKHIDQKIARNFWRLLEQHMFLKKTTAL